MNSETIRMNNEIIKRLAQEYTSEYRNSSEYTIKRDYERFNYTQAKIYKYYRFYPEELSNDTPEYIKLIPIISYQTCVAIVDDNEKVFYEVGKYSTTTSKHCTQIYNTYFRDYKRVLI